MRRGWSYSHGNQALTMSSPVASVDSSSSSSHSSGWTKRRASDDKSRSFSSVGQSEYRTTASMMCGKSSGLIVVDIESWRSGCLRREMDNRAIGDASLLGAGQA